MADNNKELIFDTDKDIFMEVRGIIEGVLDSGSTDYKTALNDIAATVNEFCFPITK